jgi:gliding motility-associated-like protein
MKKHLYSKSKVLVLNSFTGKLSLFVLAVLFCFGNDLLAGIKPPPGFGKNHVNSSVAIASPTIGTGMVTGSISACAGMASVSPHIQQFGVFGNGLTANITVTAPTGFQVSLAAGSGYGSNVTLSQSAGVVNNTVVYVRSAASAPAGNIAGNVTLTSAGAASQNVPVTGVVSPLPTISPVSNQTVNNGAATAAINFTGSGGLNWVNNTPGIGLAASGSGNIPSFTAVNTGTSPITATITVTPVSAGFAYIANSGSNTVSVINTATNTVVATIPAGIAPGAVAVSPDGRTVYVTNNSPNHFSVIPGSVLVINTATNMVIDSLIAPNASGVAVGPDGIVYVTTEHSNMGFLLGAIEIQVGPFPSGVAVSPDGTMAYVANSDNTVSVINTTPLFQDVVATVNLGFGPAGVAVSPDGSRVYATDGGSVAVINAISNTVIATIPTGGGFAGGISITPNGSRVYVAGGNANIVSVINTSTNAIVATIPVAGGPLGVSITPDGSRVYVTDSQANNVSVINTATNTIVATIPVGLSPNSVGNFISGGTGCTGAPVTFTITVNPANSANANLTSLKLSNGKLSPNFAGDTTNYTAIVPNAITSITVTPTAADSSAIITVNGVTVASGSPSASIPLSVGPNTITTVVTANSTSKTYTVIVTRRASDYAFLANLEISKGNLKPAFSKGIFAYMARVSRTTFAITVTPTAGNAFATIKVNGIIVASGTASPPIALSNGINDITIVVTAQNGVNTKTYALTVTKEPAPQNSFDKQLAVDGINVHLGISPNGDGINDILVIDGIAAYPENKLLIMNSSGTLVFETQGYDNSSRVFDGHSNKNGSMQLPGTYFYSLEYMVGKDKKYNSGFFILKY